MTAATPAQRPEIAVRRDVAQASHVIAIPAVEWQSFLERFGLRHRAWLTTVHGVERGRPVTRAASVLLESIALERRDLQPVVRLTFTNRISLCAPWPQAVRVQRTDDGAEWALEVETADGAFIRLAFRAAALPEQVDGVAPAEARPDSTATH
jgi:hypothetical protein